MRLVRTNISAAPSRMYDTPRPLALAISTPVPPLNEHRPPARSLPGHLKQQPELLSRFIPADPWVGRVSLSSPQPPGGLSLLAAAKPVGGGGGGSAGASSTVSPITGINGTSNNTAASAGNATAVSSAIGVSGSSSANGHASGVGGGGGGAKGVIGLRNEGNTCYLNASLQALARCAPFRAHLVECVSSPDVAGRPW